MRAGKKAGGNIVHTRDMWLKKKKERKDSFVHGNCITMTVDSCDLESVGRKRMGSDSRHCYPSSRFVNQDGDFSFLRITNFRVTLAAVTNSVRAPTNDSLWQFMSHSRRVLNRALEPQVALDTVMRWPRCLPPVAPPESMLLSTPAQPNPTQGTSGSEEGDHITYLPN